jgi:hypothetical protein
MTFERSDVAFVETPLAAFFERREDAAACEFVDRIRAEVEQKGDLAGIKQDIVLVGHIHLPQLPLAAC